MGTCNWQGVLVRKRNCGCPLGWKRLGNPKHGRLTVPRLLARADSHRKYAGLTHGLANNAYFAAIWLTQWWYYGQATAEMQIQANEALRQAVLAEDAAQACIRIETPAEEAERLPPVVAEDTVPAVLAVAEELLASPEPPPLPAVPDPVAETIPEAETTTPAPAKPKAPRPPSAQQQELEQFLRRVADGLVDGVAEQDGGMLVPLAMLADMPSMVRRACNWGNSAFWPSRAAQAAGVKCSLRKSGLLVRPLATDQCADPLDGDELARQIDEAARLAGVA